RRGGLRNGKGTGYKGFMDESTQERKNRVWATFIQPEVFSDEDVKFLCSNVQLLSSYNERTFSVASTRASLELRGAIRKFDKGCTRLGNIVLVFTIVATLGTLIQATFAVLSYFWPLHLLNHLKSGLLIKVVS